MSASQRQRLLHEQAVAYVRHALLLGADQQTAIEAVQGAWPSSAAMRPRRVRSRPILGTSQVPVNQDEQFAWTGAGMTGAG